MEQAIKKRGMQYQTIKKDTDLPYTQHTNMLIKMHGDFEENNIILTENDYYDYKDNYPLINAFIQSLFATKLVFFIGFSFNDPNLKIIINSIQKLLKEHFQPVYLLSDVSNDTVHSAYFKKKGVNIIWFPSKSECKEEQNTLVSPILDRKNTDTGEKVLEQIKYIIDYKEGKLDSFDLIDVLCERIHTFNNDIPFFATGLEHIWPKSDYSDWKLRAKELRITSEYDVGQMNIRQIYCQLQIGSKHVETLIQSVKTFSERKKLLATKGKQISFLRKIALENQIFEIDGLSLFTEKSIERRLKQRSYDTTDYIYKFDYEKASPQIKAISDSALQFSYKDLERPYIYHILGKDYEAYSIYKEYANQYWERGKHVLYFICTYNMTVLRDAVSFEGDNNPLIGTRRESDELKGIDLASVLSRCQINSGIKKILSDLISNHNYLDLLSELDTLANKILDSQNKAKRGSISIDQSRLILEQAIIKCFNFNSQNFIINTNTRYANVAFFNAITGLLLSNSTPENGYKSYLKLELINKDHLLLMIYMISHEDLFAIFEQHQINSIKLSEEAIQWLNEVIKNIDEQATLIQSMINWRLFIDRFNNIILLVAKSEDKIENAKLLYNIPLKYQSDTLNTTDILYSILVKYSETNILNDFITNFEQLNIPKVINRRVDIHRIGLYYKVMPQIQSEILALIRQQSIKCDNIAELVIKYKIPVFDSTILRQYIDTLRQYINKPRKKTIIYDLEYCISALFHTFEDTSDAELKEIILEYSNECKFLKFLMTPREYPVEDTGNDWFLYCKDENLKLLFEQDSYRIKIKKIIADENLAPLKERIWKLL